MKNESNPTARQTRKLLDALYADEDAARRYRKLAACAEELELEHEQHRAFDLAGEMEAEADATRDQLLALGYSPDEDEVTTAAWAWARATTR